MTFTMVMVAAGIIYAGECLVVRVIHYEKRRAAKMPIHRTLTAFINVDRNT